MLGHSKLSKIEPANTTNTKQAERQTFCMFLFLRGSSVVLETRGRRSISVLWHQATFSICPGQRNERSYRELSTSKTKLSTKENYLIFWNPEGKSPLPFHQRNFKGPIWNQVTFSRPDAKILGVVCESNRPLIGREVENTLNSLSWLDPNFELIPYIKKE